MPETAQKSNKEKLLEVKAKGWFKLYRTITDTDLDSPNRLHLWITIIENVNWKASPSPINWHGKQRYIQPGEFLVSFKRWIENRKLCYSTARKNLYYLEKTGRIRIERGNRSMVITVCNWNKYQSDDDTHGHSSGQTDGQTDGQPSGQTDGQTDGHLYNQKKKETKRKEWKKEENSNPPDFHPAEPSGNEPLPIPFEINTKGDNINPNPKNIVSIPHYIEPPLSPSELEFTAPKSNKPSNEIKYLPSNEKEIYPTDIVKNTLIKKGTKSKASLGDIELAKKWIEHSYSLVPNGKFNLAKFTDEIRITRQSIKFSDIEMDTLFLWITKDNFWAEVTISPCGLRNKSKNNGLRKIDNIVSKFLIDAKKYKAEQSMDMFAKPSFL